MVNGRVVVGSVYMLGTPRTFTRTTRTPLILKDKKWVSLGLD